MKNISSKCYFSFENGPPHSGQVSEFTKPKLMWHFGQYTLAAQVLPLGFGTISVPQFSQNRIADGLKTAAISIVELHFGHL